VTWDDIASPFRCGVSGTLSIAYEIRNPLEV
jgi:hypothetical protein